MAYPYQQFLDAREYTQGLRPCVADPERFHELRKRYKGTDTTDRNRRAAFRRYPWSCVQWALFGGKK